MDEKTITNPLNQGQENSNDPIKITVLGCGNVGVAIAADLSIGGHDVSLIKTSHSKESVFYKIRQNNNRVLLKENCSYRTAVINEVSHDISKVTKADVVIVTIQSTYHENLIERISKFLNGSQIVICICSYMSSFYFKKALFFNASHSGNCWPIS